MISQQARSSGDHPPENRGGVWPITTYIAAEENAGKAIAIMRTQVAPGPVVQSIGRASLKLIETAGLSAGEYKVAADDDA
jgi:hypothetical protein